MYLKAFEENPSWTFENGPLSETGLGIEGKL